MVLKASPSLNHIPAIHFVLGQITVVLVDFYTESITGDDEVVPIVILYLGSRHLDIALFAVLQFHGRSLVRIERQLVFCHYMSGGKQSFTVLQLIGNIQQPLGALASPCPSPT